MARPADHELIRKAIEEIAKREPPETAPTMVVYTIPLTGVGGGKAAARTGGALAASTALKTMFPAAAIHRRRRPHPIDRRRAQGRPCGDQGRRRRVGKKESSETAPRVVVYTLDSANTTTVVPMLTAMFPAAQFSAGTSPSQVVAMARPGGSRIDPAGDQADVETRSDRDCGDRHGLHASAEPLEYRRGECQDRPGGRGGHRAGHAVPAGPIQRGQRSLSTGRLGAKADHAAIKAAVDELSKVQAPLSLVYHFRTADPKTAATVLASLVPRAQIAVDVTSRTLVASATPEDHAKIKTTVEEMDRSDTGSEAPRLQVHRVISADAGSLVKVLTALYKTRPDVSVALDVNNNAVVAVAPPSQQDLIHGLVEQADKGLLADTNSQLQLYPLKDVVDATATLNILTALFAKQATQVQLSIEPRTNQLVAVAQSRAAGDDSLGPAQMKSDDRIMEVVQLKAVDALTAQTAIDRLFTENGLIRGPDAPQDDADPIGQQLFIKATKVQLAEIHKLLGEMGETALLETKTNSGSTRVIPFQGDAAAALKEILKVWPQLRSNEIQVTNPAPEAAAARPTTVIRTEPARPAVAAPMLPKPYAASRTCHESPALRETAVEGEEGEERAGEGRQQVGGDRCRACLAVLPGERGGAARDGDSAGASRGFTPGRGPTAGPQGGADRHHAGQFEHYHHFRGPGSPGSVGSPRAQLLPWRFGRAEPDRVHASQCQRDGRRTDAAIAVQGHASARGTPAAAARRRQQFQRHQPADRHSRYAIERLGGASQSRRPGHRGEPHPHARRGRSATSMSGDLMKLIPLEEDQRDEGPAAPADPLQVAEPGDRRRRSVQLPGGDGPRGPGRGNRPLREGVGRRGRPAAFPKGETGAIALDQRDGSSAGPGRAVEQEGGRRRRRLVDDAGFLGMAGIVDVDDAHQSSGVSR